MINSAEGKMKQCESCFSIYLVKDVECPHCAMVQSNRPKKRRRGRPKKSEGWIHIGEI